MSTELLGATPDGRTPRDGGFMLLELIVVMSIAGILVSIGIWGFTSHQRTAEHQGTQRQLVSQLRSVAELAVSEGRTYCVAVEGTGRSYSVFRSSCSTGSAVRGPLRTGGAAVTIAATVTSLAPVPACAPGATCLYFYPRGTASPAQLTVRSAVRTPVYTVRVEGLTGRVS